MSDRWLRALNRQAHAARPELAYGLAVVLVAVFSAVRIGLQPWLEGDGPLLMFMIPVAVSAYVGGTGPGALGIVLSAVAVSPLFSPSHMNERLPLALLILFVFEASAILWLIRWLRVTNARLRDALAAAEQARADAETAGRAQEQLVARVSHEWRSPVTSLGGWAWQLERRAGEPSFVRRAASSMRRAVDMQARLLADLLDYSRGVHGKLTVNPEQVALGDILRTAAEDVSAAARRKQIRIELPAQEGETPVWGDRVRLAQIFVNLLQNAVKFTPAEGRVTVDCVPHSDSIEVSISDTGVGIPSSALSTIFDPFAQTDERRDAGRGGLGLGLSIVRELVQLHGGSVSAHSEGPAMGSTFVVRLPRLATRQEHESAQMALTQA